MDVREVPTGELSEVELAELRRVLDDAFDGEFTDDDWDHTIGGIHVLGIDDGIAAHASVVPRRLVAGDRALRTGYVEGVATAPDRRQRGHATAVMRAAGRIIREDYELGGLSTALPDFYVTLGWEVWRGPTYVSAPTGLQRTPEEDGAVMTLRTETTKDLDATVPLICDWRKGDVW